MRIDLAEYAQEYGFSEDATLIRYLAERISKRSDLGHVKPSALVSWMRQWPWFLVLDGLDEVTEPTVRKRLIARVAEFVTTAEGDDCDVFVVLTTRPIGYVETIVPTQFGRLDLDYLEPAEAVAYGTLVTRVRLRNDLGRYEKVVRQLRAAAKDEALANLLRTPLQVLIMTIIIGGAGQFAPDRFNLFWSYYETVFRRERDKQSGLQRILQNHGQQIEQLHARVGFELQVRSEAGDRSYATLTRQELEGLTWQVLHDAGFKPASADADLLSKILTAATHRLVLIVPRGDDGYGFDVRSLQELMAATHLTAGPLDVVTTRLRAAAPNPHWRNSWIFAAGRLFAKPQDHEHRAIVELVQSIDQDAFGRLGEIVPVGPRLALDLVDDGMARSLPKWRDQLVRTGLRILQEPIPPDLLAAVRVLVRFADTGDEQRNIIAEALRDALNGSVAERANAEKIPILIHRVTDEMQVRASTRGLSGVRKHPGLIEPSPVRNGWDDFEEEIATYPASGDTLVKLGLAAQAIRNIAQDGMATESDYDAITAALGDKDAARALATAVEHVVAHELTLVAILRDDVLPAIHRTAVGERLR